MNQVDAYLLLILALADLGLFAYLRRRRSRNVVTSRMLTSLRLHLRQQRVSEWHDLESDEDTTELSIA